jgi:peptide/nickel transport system permease protein
MATKSLAADSPKSPLRKATSQFVKDRRAMAGFLLVLVVVLSALFAPLLSPYDPTENFFDRILEGPSRAHLFGTDELGRDILSRVIAGSRVSFAVGLFSVGTALLAGVVIGLLAGYFGGWLDSVLMRFMDVLFAFPPILLALAITAALGPSLTNAMIGIAIVYIPTFARVARSQVLYVREMTYIESAKASGARNGRIIFKHVLPNSLTPVVVQATVLFADAIIVESYLSFLGLGAQPPTPSWGSMLQSAMGYLEMAPWMAWFPGIAIFVAVFGLNLLGDGLRDVFDPRSR